MWINPICLVCGYRVLSDGSIDVSSLDKGSVKPDPIGSAAMVVGSYAVLAGAYYGGMALMASGPAAAANPKTQDTLSKVVDWLGPDALKIINKNGDLIFVSADNLRKIQFHLNNYYPHHAPHIQIEEFINGGWDKIRIFLD